MRIGENGKSTFKNAALLTLLLVCAVFFTTCTKAPSAEEGKYLDVEVSDEDTAESHESIFTKLNPPYPYHFTEFRNTRAYMKFDLPSTWSVSVWNERHIEISTPAEDSFLPSLTMHILYNYNGVTDDPNIAETSDVTEARSFSRIFQPELIGLEYQIYNNKYVVRSYSVPDDILLDPDFANENNGTVCLEFHRNIDLVSQRTRDFAPDTATIINCYAKWHNIPMVISCIVPASSEEAASEIIQYIVSSISEVPHRSPSLEAVTIESVTVPVPTSFQGDSSSNCFFAPSDSLDSTAGMAIGVFSLNSKEEAHISPDNFDNWYGNQIALSFVSDGSYQAATSSLTKEMSLSGNPATLYDSTISLVSLQNTYQGNAYGQPAVFRMKSVVVDASDHNQKIISLWYQETQSDIADQIYAAIISGASLN